MGEGRVLQLAGRHREALALYREASGEIDALVANDGIDIVNQQVRARILGGLAESQKSLDDPAWAETMATARGAVARMARMNGDYEVVRRLEMFLDGVEASK